MQRILLTLLSCALATAANLPTLKLLPRLSALTSEGAPEPAEPMPYTAVSLLTTHGAALLNALLGTSIDAASDEAALCADVSAPAGPGAPSIVLLASPQGNPADGATPALAPLPLAVLAAADVWVAVLPASADEQALDSFLSSLVQRVARLAEAQHACGGGQQGHVAEQGHEEEQGQEEEQRGSRQHRHQLLLIFSSQLAGPRPDEGAAAAAAAAAAAVDEQRARRRLAALWAERRLGSASASGLEELGELDELLEVSVASVPPPSDAASFQAAGSALLARFVQPSHEAYLLAHARLLHAPPAALAHLPILLQELGRHLDRAAAPAPAAAVAPAAPLPRAARNAAPPPLLPRAAVARLAPPRLWGQLVRCERARRLAVEGAATEGAALRADVAAASLNPLQTFASQADAIHARALACYERHARDGSAGGGGGGGSDAGAGIGAGLGAGAVQRSARAGAGGAVRRRWRGGAEAVPVAVAEGEEGEEGEGVEGGAVHAAKRLQLEREIAAQLLRLTRLQLGVLRADALDSFQADLAITMAEAKVYQKAAGKLCERGAARFERAARASLPAAVARGRATQALPRRGRLLLLQQMRDMAQLHEAEAADLGPRECDVAEGPDPLWKQALRQVVGLAFNGAQFYLLQYLPAKRADRKAERLQPRGPLF